MNPVAPSTGHRLKGRMLGVAGAMRFNLSRWFAALSLVTIAAIAVGASLLLNWFLTDRLILQEAKLTREFVHSVMTVETKLQDYFADPKPETQASVEMSFQHIARIPDTLRFNAYGPNGMVIWSSDRQLIGRNFGPNHELDQALTGAVVAKQEDSVDHEHGKGEHVDLRHELSTFVEIYVPVTDAGRQRVLGVIEFYRNPVALHQTLVELRRYIALGAGVSALVLYLALFGLVRKADLTIREQQRALVENETLAVIGEMSSAVAHGIRNPLASIRSSAELMQSADAPDTREAAGDIVAQSDRLEVWVRELLSYTRPIERKEALVDLPPLVSRCLEDFARELERRSIQPAVALDATLPAVRGDTLLLGQVLRSLVANAIEALEHGGHVTIRGERGERGRVVLSVEDDGPGIAAEHLARAGKPFFTTKTRGLGVGLALARRVVERFGGQMEIDSAPGQGTAVRLHMLTA